MQRKTPTKTPVHKDQSALTSEIAAANAGLSILRTVLTPLRWLTVRVAGRALAARGTRQASTVGLTSIEAPHAVIQRDGLLQRVDAFLRQDHKYGLVLGSLGTGKSVAMTQIADLLRERGWSVLLIANRQFSLTAMAELLKQHGDTWCLPSDPKQFVRLWSRRVPSFGRKRLALLIDGVDEWDAATLGAELQALNHLIHPIRADRIRVVISCDDSSWDRVRPHLHIFQSPTNYCAVEQIEDFSDVELMRALARVDATQVLRSNLPGGRLDPHEFSLRILLLHPSTFGVFAELLADRDQPQEGDVSWSELMRRYEEVLLDHVYAVAGIPQTQARRCLVAIAGAQISEKGANGRMPCQEAELALRGIGELDMEPRQLVRGLANAGVLVVDEGRVGPATLTFRNADLAGYFLSFVLETRAAGLGGDSLSVFVADQLELVDTIPVIFEAILAWLDRLVDSGDRDRVRVAVEVLLQRYPLHPEVVFRLLRPGVVSVLLDLLADDSAELPHLYGALRAVRSSEVSRERVRPYLSSFSPEPVRRLAIELCGRYQDEDSIRLLIDVLRDTDDWQTVTAVCTALYRIGRASVAPLCEAALTVSGDMGFRRRCIWGIRAVGWRTPEASRALHALLASGGLEDAALEEGAIHAAAHLRDRSVESRVASLLDSSDEALVEAAATYFTFVPAASRLPALRTAYYRWRMPGRPQGAASRLVEAIAAAHDYSVVYDALGMHLDSASDRVPESLAGLVQRYQLEEAGDITVADLVERAGSNGVDERFLEDMKLLDGLWTIEALDAAMAWSHSHPDSACRILDAVMTFWTVKTAGLQIFARGMALDRPMKRAVRILGRYAAADNLYRLAELLERADP